jgi:hypothetical protein
VNYNNRMLLLYRDAHALSILLLQGILDERRVEGKYKIEQRDFIDVFLTEIDSRAHDTSPSNFYTGTLPYNSAVFLCHL